MTLRTAKINDISFSFVNEDEFAFIYNEIFYFNTYKFTAETDSPFIVDCGANIGLSILHFKKLYPRAKVIAFEPHPATFKLLELNVRQNNLSDVELVNAAVSNNIGEMDFYVRKETSSSWPWTGLFSGVKTDARYTTENFKTIQVPTVKLSSYLTQPVDLLKLDIEGMEAIVLKEIEEQLPFIKEVRMEFHGSIYNEANSLEIIISLLSRSGLQCAFKLNNGKMVRRIDQVKRTEPYTLIIYSNRRQSGLRRSMVLYQMDRVRRGSNKLLAMMPYKGQCISTRLIMRRGRLPDLWKESNEVWS